MLNEKHDLLHEFPEHRETIHKLKMGNPYFSRMKSIVLKPASKIPPMTIWKAEKNNACYSRISYSN